MLFKKKQFVSQVYTHRRGTATAVYQEETQTLHLNGVGPVQMGISDTYIWRLTN